MSIEAANGAQCANFLYETEVKTHFNYSLNIDSLENKSEKIKNKLNSSECYKINNVILYLIQKLDFYIISLYNLFR